MTKERWSALMNEPDSEKAILTMEEMKQEWHWCPEYDGLLCVMKEEPGCECYYVDE